MLRSLAMPLLALMRAVMRAHACSIAVVGMAAVALMIGYVDFQEQAVLGKIAAPSALEGPTGASAIGASDRHGSIRSNHRREQHAVAKGAAESHKTAYEHRFASSKESALSRHGVFPGGELTPAQLVFKVKALLQCTDGNPPVWRQAWGNDCTNPGNFAAPACRQAAAAASKQRNGVANRPDAHDAIVTWVQGYADKVSKVLVDALHVVQAPKVHCGVNATGDLDALEAGLADELLPGEEDQYKLAFKQRFHAKQQEYAQADGGNTFSNRMDLGGAPEDWTTLRQLKPEAINGKTPLEIFGAFSALRQHALKMKVHMQGNLAAAEAGKITAHYKQKVTQCLAALGGAPYDVEGQRVFVKAGGATIATLVTPERLHMTTNQLDLAGDVDLEAFAQRQGVLQAASPKACEARDALTPLTFAITTDGGRIDDSVEFNGWFVMIVEPSNPNVSPLQGYNNVHASMAQIDDNAPDHGRDALAACHKAWHATAGVQLVQDVQATVPLKITTVSLGTVGADGIKPPLSMAVVTEVAGGNLNITMGQLENTTTNTLAGDQCALA